MHWLIARFSEPESRAAVAGVLASLGGLVGGTMDKATAVNLILGSIVAFLIPSTKPPQK